MNGDIVWIDKEEEYFWIEWDKDMARFIIVGKDFIMDFDNVYTKELEVYGNIYENSDLLKGADNIE